jgi:hypothetical protein
MLVSRKYARNSLGTCSSSLQEYGEKAANTQETVKEQGRREANRNIERKL